jgi:hypothetical protein
MAELAGQDPYRRFCIANLLRFDLDRPTNVLYIVFGGVGSSKLISDLIVQLTP